MPGYKLHGKPRLYFAGFKEHYSLFAESGIFFAAREDELRGYELRTGTVQFPLSKPVPVKLISRIAGKALMDSRMSSMSNRLMDPTLSAD